jgi:hypothetical protein
MRSNRLHYEVVELMPPAVEDGTLYISLEYMTAVHRCCCGCGERVVTPIGPTDWSVTFHGDSISLNPSVGNWGLACRSHYIISRGSVEWAPQWSPKRIDAGRRADFIAKQRHFEEITYGQGSPQAGGTTSGQPRGRLSRTSRMRGWFWRHRLRRDRP